MPTLLMLALPFFFILAIVYGALEVSGVFKNKAVIAIISLVIAFFTISSDAAVSFIYDVLPFAIIVFIIVFLLGFIFSLFKGEKKDYSLFAVVCALGIVFVANQGYDMINAIIPASIGAENFIAIVGVIFIVVIFYAVYKKWGEQ